MKHGYSSHPLYTKFNQMKQRCYNKKSPLYPTYGGRGIVICDEWLNDVRKFIEWGIANGYDEGHCSINRIDPKKGYSPENCNFMTISQNSSYHPYSGKQDNMFRCGQTIYCKNEKVAQMVREYARTLNRESECGGRDEYNKFDNRIAAKAIADSAVIKASTDSLKDMLARNPLFQEKNN